MGFEFNKAEITASNYYKYQKQERIEDFNLGVDFFKYRVSDPVIGRFWQVDPLASDMPEWSPYVFEFNNPIRYVDPDGRKPVDIFKQTKGGGYVKVSNQGGSQNHTYINNNGTTSFYNTSSGSMRTVNNSEMKASIATYSAAAKKRKANVIAGLEVTDNIGDGLATLGIVAAPFTEGASLGLTAIGEGISLAATAAKHGIKFSTEGATTENKVDFAVDMTFEVLPKQVESAVERSGLGDVSKKIIRAQVKQMSMTAEKIAEKTIEHNRTTNE